MRNKNKVKFMTIAENLEDLNGLTLKEITEKLGYNSIYSAETGLWKLKRAKKIDYKRQDNVFTDFELLDAGTKTSIEDKELADLGLYLKSLERYRVVKNEFGIALSPTAKEETKQKADTNILRALDKIPNHLYAKIYLEEEQAI